MTTKHPTTTWDQFQAEYQKAKPEHRAFLDDVVAVRLAIQTAATMKPGAPPEPLIFCQLHLFHALGMTWEQLGETLVSAGTPDAKAVQCREFYQAWEEFLGKPLMDVLKSKLLSHYPHPEIKA